MQSQREISLSNNDPNVSLTPSLTISKFLAASDRIAGSVTRTLALGDSRTPIAASEEQQSPPRGSVTLQTGICSLGGRKQRRKERRMCGMQINLRQG